jgi:hypothetical protein
VIVSKDAFGACFSSHASRFRIHFRTWRWAMPLPATASWTILAQTVEPVVEEEVELPEGTTSLDLMQAVYRDSRQPMTRRMRAAQIAIGYEHLKLAVTANTNLNIAEQMEAFARAIGKSNVIDAKKNYDVSAPLPIPRPRPEPVVTDPADGFRRRL